MPDINSPVLDVGIALAFIFFLLSTFSSAITEGVSWLLHKRAKDMEKGLKKLLEDPGVANALFDHPLVKPLVPTGLPARIRNVKTPAYMSSRTFALALLNNLAPDEGEDPPTVEELREQVQTLPDPLQKQLLPVLNDAAATVQGFRKSIETWFDDAMDRLSGLYKRWSQLVICVMAVVVTVALNVDTLRVADRLWNDEALRASVVGAATQLGDQSSEAPPTATGATDSTSSDDPCEIPAPTATPEGQPVPDAVAQTDQVTECVKDLQLPIGWSDANDHVSRTTILGWLITAFAVALGAPFWFDALGRLSRLRSTGKKPDATGP
jgi:hypothetical protein